MANTLTFPSDAFPGFPALSAPQPEGWVALAAVGLPMALAKEVGKGVFRPNVLVTLTRHGADYSVEKASKALTEKLKALPRYKGESHIDHEVNEDDPIQGFTVEGRFSGGRGELLFQNVRVLVINRGYVYDVVEITGTGSLLTGDNGKQEIRDIVDGIVIDLS